MGIAVLCPSYSFYKSVINRGLLQRKNKESRPRGPGFDLPPEGVTVPLLSQHSAGVMEYWSAGVQEIQRLATVLVELRKKRWNTIIFFLESPITSRSERITPLLRYSNTPRGDTCQAKPTVSDLALRTRFSSSK